MANQTSVIVASDRPVTVLGLCAAVESADDLTVFGTTASAVDLLVLLTSCPECIGLVHAALFAGVDGKQALRRLEERDLACRIVGLGGSRPAARLAALLAHGVRSLVLETEPVDELLGAVRATAAGRSYVSPALQTVRDRVLRPSDGSMPHELLNDREVEVLTLIANGLCDKEIGLRLGLSRRTVAWHIAEARTKLGAVTRAQVVLAAARDGWLPLD